MSLSSDCSLIINNITAEDAGQYICRIRKGVGYSVTYVYVNVVTAGIDLHHRAGDDVVLPCHLEFTSDDCSYLDWIYNNIQNADGHFKVTDGDIVKTSPRADRMSLSSNCSLIINNITAEDAGHYICWNGYGDSTSVYLNVLTDSSVINTRLIIGSVVGGLMVVLVSIATFLIIYRMKVKRNNPRNQTVHSVEGHGTQIRWSRCYIVCKHAPVLGCWYIYRFQEPMEQLHT
ncbi:CXADR-like membrane protein isoform X3 [Cololabis saira]|uniref:CXADR-like membrane protein isoform X3 n=1 Tax=Cololabis saira TaxID=129043 RepID=UPI002AD567FC|nr:CXADR-like membrane protein isoform X3 [Cololabis saira]